MTSFQLHKVRAICKTVYLATQALCPVVLVPTLCGSICTISRWDVQLLRFLFRQHARWAGCLIFEMMPKKLHALQSAM